MEARMTLTIAYFAAYGIVCFVLGAAVGVRLAKSEGGQK